jgi:LysM repeat protein
MWRQFMLEAHAYLQLPPKEFEVPEETDTAKCGGRTEVFKEGEEPTSGGCRPGRGSGDPSGSGTPTPTPAGPVFPTRVPGTPTPTPTAEATPEPTPEPPPEEPPVVFFYTVKEGDTLEGIAAKFGVTLDAILDLNPELKENKPIQPGDVLKIPLAAGEDPDGG